jgi:predicted site-specific integrase-resolvase
MTAQEAASLLKVSPSWVKRHRREGHLKEWKQDGQRFLYARREIETILNSPEYGWRMQKRAKTLEKRKGYLPPKPTRYPQQAAARNGLISSREAREILGVDRVRLRSFVQCGKLWCVQNYPGLAGSNRTHPP